MINVWKDQKTPALAIVARGDQITTIKPNEKYIVKSQSKPKIHYTIEQAENTYICTCEHFQATHQECIHILAVKFQQHLKNTKETILNNTTKCDKCGSTNIVKNGIRKNKSGIINRYKCKNCGYRFTDNNGFKKKRNEPEKIALALDLYFRGLSIRKISEHFKQVYNLKVSHMTVYRWLVTYSRLASEWMDKQQVHTGDRWHIDETMIKIDGTHHYLWNVLDSESRFLLATHISRDRDLPNTQKPIQKAKQATLDRPLEVFTDGMMVYPQAIKKELGQRNVYGIRGSWSPHHRVPSIRAPISNNRIERLHGTEKERIKVMRGFDQESGSMDIMEGFRVNYNLVKTHQGIGCTPFEATGKLDINGFKWLTLIQKSIQYKKANNLI